MKDLPDFYDDLVLFREALWEALARGARDRRSAFHVPTLATVDAAGRPRARTVVLRAVDAAAGTLRVHCDRRSDKAREIAGSGAFALQAYDPDATLQVRAEGRATLHTDDALADAAWDAAQAMSRVCYGAEPGPGTVLPAGGAYALPDAEAARTLGRPHFAVLLLRPERLEALYLARAGHRRAAWAREADGAWTGRWLAP
ncbi:pyridoxamine 5'-phosphate oxidase family protein [Methylobacterium sp. A54F]